MSVFKKDDPKRLVFKKETSFGTSPIPSLPIVHRRYSTASPEQLHLQWCRANAQLIGQRLDAYVKDSSVETKREAWDDAVAFIWWVQQSSKGQ